MPLQSVTAARVAPKGGRVFVRGICYRTSLTYVTKIQGQFSSNCLLVPVSVVRVFVIFSESLGGVLNGLPLSHSTGCVTLLSRTRAITGHAALQSVTRRPRIPLAVWGPEGDCILRTEGVKKGGRYTLPFERILGV